jgi:hypothetical protein
MSDDDATDAADAADANADPAADADADADANPAGDATEADAEGGGEEASRHHVTVDSDELPRLPTDDEGFGGPDDPSDEQPMLVSTPSDEAAALPPGDEAPSELQQAYECLELRTPIDEFLAFAEARRETMVRLGEAERSELAGEALETGLRALREVMGAVAAPRKEAQ